MRCLFGNPCARVIAPLLAIALLLAAQLSGCASHGTAPEAPASGAGLRLKAESALYGSAVDRESLLDGSLQFAAPAQWLNYDARYSLQPALPAQPPDGVRRDIAVAPVQMLGGESLRQNLRLALPFLLDAPLRLEAEDHYGGLLRPQAPVVSRTAQLQWSPAPLAFDLRWTPDHGTDSTSPLRCQLDGAIALPGTVLTGRDSDALRVGGRGCTAQSAERGVVDPLAVSSYSASWQRRGRKSDSSLHLLMIEPAAAPAVSDTRPAPGYELGASREQRWRQWSAQSSVALRHAGHASGEPLDWSARATLRTELPQASLSASVQRAADPLWFLPGVPAIGNSVELGLGLDRWIARQLTVPNVGLGMVWRRSEATRAGQPADQSLIWTFRLTH